MIKGLCHFRDRSQISGAAALKALAPAAVLTYRTVKQL